MTATPKPGGHKKPGAAIKHTPKGYEKTTKTCPTCHGSGEVPGDDSVHARALRRA